METSLIQQYDQIRKLKTKIKKTNLELDEKKKLVSYQVKKLIEIIHDVETKCISQKHLLDSKGKPVPYETYRSPEIISIQKKNDMIKIRYAYSGSYNCGDSWQRYGTLKIPVEYLSMSNDKLRSVHTEWTMNKIEASNQETLRKNQEQHNKWVNDAREAEYKRYLELKQKYGS